MRMNELYKMTEEIYDNIFYVLINNYVECYKKIFE
jgi:hypothetical protein